MPNKAMTALLGGKKDAKGTDGSRGRRGGSNSSGKPRKGAQAFMTDGDLENVLVRREYMVCLRRPDFLALSVLTTAAPCVVDQPLPRQNGGIDPRPDVWAATPDNQRRWFPQRLTPNAVANRGRRARRGRSGPHVSANRKCSTVCQVRTVGRRGWQTHELSAVRGVGTGCPAGCCERDWRSSGADPTLDREETATERGVCGRGVRRLDLVHHHWVGAWSCWARRRVYRFITKPNGGDWCLSVGDP